MAHRRLAVVASFGLLLPNIHEAIAAACATIATSTNPSFPWVDSDGEWTLQQSSGGAITGQLKIGPGLACPQNKIYNITGQFSSSNGTFTLTGTETGPNHIACADSFTRVGSVSQPGCHNASGTFTNSGGASGNFTSSHTCYVPSETTPEFLNWGATGATVTAATYRSALNDQAYNWGGRTLSEAYPQAGTDTCWFDGGIYSSTVRGTEESNPLIGSVPTTYLDRVGAAPEVVAYYRLHNRAQCGYLFFQEMRVDCSSSNLTYKTNELYLGIGHTSVISARGGVLVQKTWGLPSPEILVPATILNVIIE
jgi:hypothetical protein